jgi:hypothetical protein
MARKKKRAPSDEPNAELLPPREALSLWPTTDPAAYTGLLGDPTASAGPTDPAAASGAASSTSDSARNLVDAQASGSADETVSEEPQTVTRDDSQTASSET